MVLQVFSVFKMVDVPGDNEGKAVEGQVGGVGCCGGGEMQQGGYFVDVIYIGFVGEIVVQCGGNGLAVAFDFA